MTAQFRRLADASQLPAVTIQVLPFSQGAHASMGVGFTVMEFAPLADPSVVPS